jgi:hypothetical protein
MRIGPIVTIKQETGIKDQPEEETFMIKRRNKVPNRDQMIIEMYIAKDRIRKIRNKAELGLVENKNNRFLQISPEKAIKICIKDKIVARQKWRKENKKLYKIRILLTPISKNNKIIISQE